MIDGDTTVGAGSLSIAERSTVEPRISVVVCAYTEDRWEALTDACRSVRAQLDPRDELILVIDHNERLLERARTAMPDIRVIGNTGARGLSDARNTGVAAASRDIVAFLDDDAVPRAGWLGHIRSAFEDPATAVVGTRVLPRWQGDGRAPRWFPAEFGWVVGCGYQGQPTRRATVRNPIGASMAIRRSVLHTVGGFSQVVGRVGALPVGCEETELCIRLVQTMPHLNVVFDPRAAVDHLVPSQRQNLRYFVRRCFYEGCSKRAVAKLRGNARALSAERTYVRKVLPAAMLRGVSPARLRHDPAELLRAGTVALGLASTVCGFAYAALKRGTVG
jgi:GT2 family glycosyltransferase